jgi:hypothetical protein
VNEANAYLITLPDDWQVTELQNSDASITSDRVTVNIRTATVDRVRFPTVQLYAESGNPLFPAGWDEVDLLGRSSIRDGGAVEFQYNANLNGVRQQLFIHWYLRGSRLVEVSLRTDTGSWQDPEIQEDIRMVLASFAVDFAGPRVSSEAVLAAVTARFPGNPHSGVIVRDESASGTVELSCSDAVKPHLLQPEYDEPGEWKVRTSLTPHGFNEWTVYEPELQVVAASGNESEC